MTDEKSLDLLRLTDSDNSTPKATIQNAIDFYIRHAPELMKYSPDGVGVFDTLDKIVDTYIDHRKITLRKAKAQLESASSGAGKE